jgi:hypothetical protein
MEGESAGQDGVLACSNPGHPAPSILIYGNVAGLPE